MHRRGGHRLARRRIGCVGGGRSDGDVGGPGPGVLGARSISLRRRRDPADPTHPGQGDAGRHAQGLRRARHAGRHARLPVRQRVHVHPAATVDRCRPARHEPATAVRAEGGRSVPPGVPPSDQRRPSRARIERPWRKVIADWEHGGRALIESRNLALQKVDLSELDDPTLIEHVLEVIEHCRASWEHHFWLHGYDLGPIGLYLAGCREWGVEPVDAIPLLEGASPSTVGPMHVSPVAHRGRERSGRQPTISTTSGRSVAEVAERPRSLPRVPRRR